MLYGVDWREGGGPDTKQDGGRVFREHQTPWSIAKDHRNAGGKRAREQSGRASGSENWQSFLPLSNWIRAVAPTSWRAGGARRAGPGQVPLAQERRGGKVLFGASENCPERTEKQKQIWWFLKEASPQTRWTWMRHQQQHRTGPADHVGGTESTGWSFFKGAHAAIPEVCEAVIHCCCFRRSIEPDFVLKQ